MSKVVVVIREGGEEDWGDEIELLLNIVKDIMDNLFRIWPNGCSWKIYK